jgi:signal transduction histidine kinase
VNILMQRFLIFFVLLATVLIADMSVPSKILKTQPLSSYAGSDGAHQLPVHLQSPLKHQRFLLVTGIGYGIFVLLFFYTLVTLVSERSRNHLFFLVFLGSFALTKFSFDDLGRVLFWSDLDWVIMQGRDVLLGIMILSFILFSRSFLKVETFSPKINKILLFLALVVSVLTLGAIFSSYAEAMLIMGGISLVLLPLLLLLIIKAHKNKFYPARFYSAGLGSFLLIGIVFVMQRFGWIEDVYFFFYMHQAASAAGVIFLFCTLADLSKKTAYENLGKMNALNRLLQEKADKTLSELRCNNHVLIEKSRLAAMGEKIEQIAHQWRQPLHALALINQNLYFKTQLETVTKEDYEEVHDKMNEQLQYMSQTIDDFRNFSKSNKKKEAFFVETVIKSAISLSEGSLEQANVKTQLISKGEHTAYGMCHELMQVFMNVIKNAQDVILEKKIQKPWIKFSVTEQDNQTQIRIEDNAGGIPEDAIKRVFEPYFSTKQASGGSGIGLYMSKEIIEKSMLGQISVDNSEKGAVFTISLPKTTKKVSKN